MTSSAALMPAVMARRVGAICAASLGFRSSSIKTTSERGKASSVKTSMDCSTSLSKMRNSDCWRSGTRSPFWFFTVTGRTTRSDFTEILFWASVCGAAGGGDVVVGAGAGADWANRQFAAKNTMNRRRSMSLVPEDTEYTQTWGLRETWPGERLTGETDERLRGILLGQD